MRLLLLFAIAYAPQSFSVSASAELEREYVSTLEKLGHCLALQSRTEIETSLPNAQLVDKDQLLDEQFSLLRCGDADAIRRRLGEIAAIQARASTPKFLVSQAPRERTREWVEQNFYWGEGRSCSRVPGLNLESIADRKLWHQVMIEQGYTCAAKHYTDVINSAPRSAWAQNAFRSFLARPTQDFRQAMAHQNIVFVPHFSWEKYAVADNIKQQAERCSQGSLSACKKNVKYHMARRNGTLKPFPEEVLTDLEFERYMRKASPNQIFTNWRQSSGDMNQQIASLAAVVAQAQAAGKPFILVSRSSGSQVALGYLKRYGKPAGLSGWINAFGTPRGSVLSTESTFAPTFFNIILRQFLSLVDGASKLSEIVDDSTVTNLMSYMTGSVDRRNLLGLGIANELTKYSPAERSWDLPVVNLQAVPENKRRFMKLDESEQEGGFPAPPVLLAMAKHGPSEGSTLLADGAVHTRDSVTIVFPDLDHWAFVVGIGDQAYAKAMFEQSFVVGNLLGYWN